MLCSYCYHFPILYKIVRLVDFFVLKQRFGSLTQRMCKFVAHGFGLSSPIDAVFNPFFVSDNYFDRNIEKKAHGWLHALL